MNGAIAETLNPVHHNTRTTLHRYRQTSKTLDCGLRRNDECILIG
ncbi:MAG: hypothetical protein V3R51_03915 [Gammaproteobacteria bacterium]